MGKTRSDTKEKLLATAIELIWRQSYNSVSVDEICKKAGVQKGSFYHYFPSKAHLAVETMDSCMQEMKPIYDDIFSPTRHPVERFSLMVSHILDHQREISAELGHVCGCPFTTLGSELAVQDDQVEAKIKEIWEKKTAYYESALRALIREGLLPEDTDISVKANEVFSFVIGQLVMARIQNDLGFAEANMERGLFDLLGIKETEINKLKLTG